MIFGLKNVKNEAATFDTKVRKTQGSRFEGETKNLVLNMLGRPFRCHFPPEVSRMQLGT